MSAFLTISGHTMLIEPSPVPLNQYWIHLRDYEDRALCGEVLLRPATPREANGARGTCPDCNRVLESS